MPVEDDLFEKLRVELRRGSLILAVLGALRVERYGYTLRQSLEDAGLPIDEGALYPLLRRLEAQGLLASEWRIEDGPPRRYYVLSKAGAQLQRTLTASWGELVETMDGILGGRSSWLARAK